MSNGQALGGLNRRNRGAGEQSCGPDLAGERYRLDRRLLHMAHGALVLAERFVFGMLVPDAQNASAQDHDQEEHDPRAVRWSVSGAFLATAVGGPFAHSMIMIRHSQARSSVTMPGPPASSLPDRTEDDNLGVASLLFTRRVGSLAPSPVEHDDREDRSSVVGRHGEQRAVRC